MQPLKWCIFYYRESHILWVYSDSRQYRDRGRRGGDRRRERKETGGAERRDNGEGWERTPHAALYDGYNDHYLVQCLGAGAAAAGMTSPTGASSEDQTRCLSGPLATHCTQLNSTDGSSKCKRSREYTQGNTTALCILEQTKEKSNPDKKCWTTT